MITALIATFVWAKFGKKIIKYCQEKKIFGISSKVEAA
jgi:hypothetical protein